MSPWLALIIPVIGAIIMLKFFSRKVLWWELLVPIVASAALIALLKLFVVMGVESDTEYRGARIIVARYYEAWETYVSQTCTRTVSCGKDCTTTESYDCSYCDDHSAYWVAIDELGQEYKISKEYYERLKKQWNAQPIFVELNRKIDKTWSCGKDGDAYEIRWDGNWETSESATWTESYVNKPQASKSAFKYNEISKKEAQAMHLYDYPREYSYYKQQTILGLDSLGLPVHEFYRYNKLFEYFNGYYGPRKHVRLYVLLFFDKPQSIAHKQESYWAGGNDNELIVCIGLNKRTKELDWVKAFSWCINKRVLVDCREDIMQDSVLNLNSIYTSIEKTVVENFEPRDLEKDFDYLAADLPTWSIVLTMILTLLVTIGTSWWCINNELEYDDPNNRSKYRSNRYYRY